MKKKTRNTALVAIFAHPDDEAFGPCGTLAIFAKTRDVYIICVTNGDAGINSSSENKKLEEIRHEEMVKSTGCMGVKKVFFLGYNDGSLNNNLYHEIAGKIQKILKNLRPEILLTFEPRGVSGHIDHVAVSMVTSYVFEKLSFVKELWYYCHSEVVHALQQEYFIYFPPGYKKSDISKTLDISVVWDKKVEAMHHHLSQKHDIDRILAQYPKRPKTEDFIILKKKNYK